ncbi:MAG: hypothetical protein ACK40Q_02590 [Pseudothermotoga sp.]
MIQTLQVQDTTSLTRGKIISQDETFSIEHKGTYAMIDLSNVNEATFIKGSVRLVKTTEDVIFMLPDDHYPNGKIFAYLQHSTSMKVFPIKILTAVGPVGTVVSFAILRIPPAIFIMVNVFKNTFFLTRILKILFAIIVIMGFVWIDIHQSYDKDNSKSNFSGTLISQKGM